MSPAFAQSHAVSGLSIGRLLQAMDGLFDQFICHTWKPRCLEVLRQSVAVTENELAEIGPPEVRVSDLVAAVQQRTKSRCCAYPDVSADGIVVTHGTEGLRAWASSWRATKANFLAWFEQFLAADGLPRELEAIIERAFDDEPPLRAVRFEGAREQLAAAVRLAYEKAVQQLEPQLRASMLAKFGEGMKDAWPTANAVEDMQRYAIDYVFVDCVCAALEDGLSQALADAGDRRVSESSTWVAHRAKLTAQRAQLAAAIDAVEKIGNVLAGPP